MHSIFPYAGLWSKLPYAVHAQLLPMLNIALCSLRLILPYSHRYTRSILPYGDVQYYLMQSTLAIALCCPCLILALCRPRCYAVHCTLLPYAVHMLNIALCWPCSMISTLNIALCSLRLIIAHAQYCHVLSTLNIALQPPLYTLNIALCCSPRSHYCLVLCMLNIALQTRCPHWILPYAVNAQYCLMLAMLNDINAEYCVVQSTLNTALRCPRSILPYSHAVHAQYCLTATLSTLNIALQPRCPCSILPWAVHTLDIALQPHCPRSILPYAVHARYCLVLSTLIIALCCQCSCLVLSMLNIALQTRCPHSR